MHIDQFTEGLSREQSEIIYVLHDLIMENPAITLKRRWKLPFYYRKSWICYFNILKDGRLEWAFTRGNELSNELGWLESRGRKQIYSVSFGSMDDIDIGMVRVQIQEALLLDEQVAYQVKKG
jgi:hypothetical protein